MAISKDGHDERTCSVCRDYAQRQAMPWWLWLAIAAGVVVVAYVLGRID